MDRAPASIERLIDRLETTLQPLRASGDQVQHFHATYLRSTRAIGAEIRRGGFLDNAWIERLDLVFAGLYLEALEAWQVGRAPSGPWQVAFEATRDPSIGRLRYVLLGMNAHVNFDLPQALLAVMTDDEFDDPAAVQRRAADHNHIDDILTERVAEEDRELAAVQRPGERTVLDRLLQPLNRAGTRRFLTEARAKVWRNARLLSEARRSGPEALARRIGDLEEVSRARVADLRAPGQVLLRLARRGFGVVLPDGR